MKTRILKINTYFNDHIKERSRLILLLSFILLVSGCASSKSVNIFYSGNFNGVIEDCHCPKVSEGSILNHYGFFKDSIRSGHKENIYVCTGNIYSYNFGDKENRIILEVLDSLGYDFLAVGRNESELYDKLGKNKTASYNIANLSGYIAFEKGGFRITITSLTDPSFSKYTENIKIYELRMSEFIQFADSLKKKTDLLIVVTNLESAFEKKVFNRVESIDIMISNTNSTAESISFGERLYISHGQNAEYMGKLNISKKNDEDYIFKNTFIKMNSELFRDDEELKTTTDSLRVKYGIELRDDKTDY
jgi:hypothetical protein